MFVFYLLKEFVINFFWRGFVGVGRYNDVISVYGRGIMCYVFKYCILEYVIFVV